MLRKIILILAILLNCICGIQYQVIAQKATAKVSVHPFEISIGQQATVNLEVIAPKGQQFVLPVYPDTLITGIEVLSVLKPDTIYAHEVMTVSQKYIITSFDSALYHVPFIPVYDGKDTIRTNDFALKVVSPQLSEATLKYLEEVNTQQTDSLDFNRLEVYDIKTILEAPFVWTDYWIYGLIFLLIVIGAILGRYLYLKYKQNGGVLIKPKKIVLPHVVALSALDQVREKKLWQQGREKEYYTEVTDILRTYIEDRYGVNAMEMTSDEILSVLHGFLESDSSYKELGQILKLADLVKFAKYKPFPDENDLSLVNSYLFVNQTKREPVQEEPDENGDEMQQGEQLLNSESETQIDWKLISGKNDNDSNSENK